MDQHQNMPRRSVRPDQPMLTMSFRVLLPEKILIERPAIKVVAQGRNGSFTLLPKHIDYVTPIVAGVILVTDESGNEVVIGTDDGTLVKMGSDVHVATWRAVVGESLEALRETVKTEFQSRSEQDLTARQALAGLEASIIRRFIELEEG